MLGIIWRNESTEQWTLLFGKSFSQKSISTEINLKEWIKTVWYEEKRRDCIFYYEERDMGATVPTCKIDPGYAYGECPCSPGCRYYLSMNDAYTILRKQLGIKEITCGNCLELFVNHNSDESFCSLADYRQVFLKRGQKRPEWCPKKLKWQTSFNLFVLAFEAPTWRRVTRGQKFFIL